MIANPAILNEAAYLGRVGTEWVLSEIDDASFAPRNRCHDWRNYVPLSIIECWHSLSTETRLAVFCVAQSVANNEVWEGSKSDLGLPAPAMLTASVFNAVAIRITAQRKCLASFLSANAFSNCPDS